MKVEGLCLKTTKNFKVATAEIQTHHHPTGPTPNRVLGTLHTPPSPPQPLPFLSPGFCFCFFFSFNNFFSLHFNLKKNDQRQALGRVSQTSSSAGTSRGLGSSLRSLDRRTCISSQQQATTILLSLGELNGYFGRAAACCVQAPQSTTYKACLRVLLH